MRTVQGWSLSQFRKLTGYGAEDLRGREIGRLVEQGLVVLGRDRLRPTRQGLLFNDTVVAQLL
jgi:coproporphyrinogen III oxidase-like Fe-S oxidoreductase